MGKGAKGFSLFGAVLLAVSFLCSCSISGQGNTESMQDKAQTVITESERIKQPSSIEKERALVPETVPTDSGKQYEIFVPDNPGFTDTDQTKPGAWSETNAFDISGRFSPAGSSSDKSVIVISETVVLAKFQSKTWAPDICRGNAESLPDTVAVEIIQNGASKFRYISEDATNKEELANFSATGGLNRILSNLNPSHRYEITIINLETMPVKIEIRISAYCSDEEEIIRE